MAHSIGRRPMVLAAGAGLFVPRARAQPAAVSSGRLRIGVLTDLSGPYAGVTGRGSIAAAELAAEDFARTAPSFAVDIVGADCASQAAVAEAVATRWLDADGVSVIVDVPGSDAAVRVAEIVRARDRAALFSGAGSTRLTGRLCSPNHIHWTYDTWALAHGTGRALVEDGGTTWFFITADYQFGHQLQDETEAFVRAAGGDVLGAYNVPFPASDFSDAIVQAVASGARVVGLANAGDDTVRCLRQAAAFGVTASGQRIAALLFQAADVHAVGLDAARGLVTTEAFYWDRDDASRAFAARIAPRTGGAMPGMDQAGVYAATLHCLRAAESLGLDAARASGRALVERMKAMPTDDALFGRGRIRADGRKLHDMYVFEVKTPMESRGEWDLYRWRATIPADQAFRPLADGACPLLKM